MMEAGPEGSSVNPLFKTTARPLDRVCELLLYALVIAAPWEIFQRTPLAGITLVKLAGAALIAVAALRMALARRWLVPRTGVEIPIAALVAICGVCTVHSLDHAASWRLLQIYLGYIALFYAVASVVRDVRTTERLLVALTVSSAVVSGLALLCSAGLLVPSLSFVTEHVSRRVLPGAHRDAPLRIVAASDDFNQGVFIPLMAFSLALFTFGWRSIGVVRRLGLYVTLSLLAGAMLVAVSRSSVAIALCLLGVYLLGHFWSRMRAWPLVVVLLVIAATGGWLGQRYLKAIVVRASSVSTHDPSYEGRSYGYSVAWHALPQYWLTGSGLNTSDVILIRAEHPEILRGQTLHSVPLKMFLETGVVGLLAYLALAGAFARRLWRDGVRTSLASRQLLGSAFLAWLFACFFVTCIQPLTVISMFPVMAGMALGPLARRAPLGGEAGDTLQPRANRTGFAARIGWPGVFDVVIATCVVAAVVIPNVVRYQMGAWRVAQFADYLEDGSLHEQAVEWGAAEESYRAAVALAESRADSDHSVWEQPIDRIPYFANSAKVFDLDTVYKSMDLGWTEPNARAVSEFALARTIMKLGRLREAADHMNLASLFSQRYAFAHFAAGECLWALGNFRSSIVAYRKASAMVLRPGNEPYAKIFEAMSSRINEIRALSPPSAAELLEEGRLWRLRGDWNKARDVYQRVAAAWPGEADAHFHLGVDAEIQGHETEAASEYETALRLAPNHFESALQLRRLRGWATDGRIP